MPKHLLMRNRLLLPDNGAEAPAGASGDGADTGGGGQTGDAGEGAPGSAPKPGDGQAEPEQLPDDHPLVRTLAAQKQEIKALKDKAASARTGDQSVEDRLADMQARLDAEIAAREQAEQAAETEKVSALRTRLAAGRLPAPLIERLTGTTEEELTAEIEDLAKYVVVGSNGVLPGGGPDPAQGNPPGGRGGSLEAGRARFQSSNS